MGVPLSRDITVIDVEHIMLVSVGIRIHECYLKLQQNVTKSVFSHFQCLNTKSEV